MRKITHIGPFTAQVAPTGETRGQGKVTESHLHFVEMEGQGWASANLSSWEANAAHDVSQRWN